MFGWTYDDQPGVEGSGPSGPAERPMGGYLSLPALPPKVAKPKKKRTG